jgi:hypothetical protein
MPDVLHFVVVNLIPAVLGPAALVAGFRYLTRRAYLKTAKELCDRHGLVALDTFLAHTAGAQRPKRWRLTGGDQAR